MFECPDENECEHLTMQSIGLSMIGFMHEGTPGVILSFEGVTNDDENNTVGVHILLSMEGMSYMNQFTADMIKQMTSRFN